MLLPFPGASAASASGVSGSAMDAAVDDAEASQRAAEAAAGGAAAAAAEGGQEALQPAVPFAQPTPRSTLQAIGSLRSRRLSDQNEGQLVSEQLLLPLLPAADADADAAPAEPQAAAPLHALPPPLPLPGPEARTHRTSSGHLQQYGDLQWYSEEDAAGAAVVGGAAPEVAEATPLAAQGGPAYQPAAQRQSHRRAIAALVLSPLASASRLKRRLSGGGGK